MHMSVCRYHDTTISFPRTIPSPCECSSLFDNVVVVNVTTVPTQGANAHLLQRHGFNAEISQTRRTFGHDIVGGITVEFSQAWEGRHAKHLSHAVWNPNQRSDFIRQPDGPHWLPDGVTHILAHLRHRVRTGSRQLVRRAHGCGVRDGGDNSLRHVTNVDGTLQGVAIVGQRKRSGHLVNGSKAVEKVVLIPNHDSGAQNRGVGEFLTHGKLAKALGLEKRILRCRIRAERRNVNQAGSPCLCSGACDNAGAVDVDIVERKVAGRMLLHGHVDDNVRVLHRVCHCLGIQKLVLWKVDLSQVAHHAKMSNAELTASEWANDLRSDLSKPVDSVARQEGAGCIPVDAHHSRNHTRDG
eukprot:m.171823 g.171823  ORF g.171823 m.171823 type:complete len:355 (+) comp13430_c0_seq1:145-1209(+)